MGAYRTRRPFVWQDEMGEVRNLFRRVAKVRGSAFTGFSLWKDEPTAETLSKNRLRRRRCQYALELTHLNYGESPYEALTHLHNIRGMCSRIQRQDHFVERKKKNYDLDLQPALLRRPMSSYSWSKEGSERVSLRSSRPGSAPVLVGIPLHYTPCKPTALYDATHGCPRYRELPKRPSMLNSSGNRNKPGRSMMALKGMASSHNWEPTATAASGISSPMPSSTATSTRTLSVAPCFRLGADSSPGSDEPSRSRRKEHLLSVYSEVDTTSDADTTTALALLSEVGSSEASVFSSSPVERPPSRMMNKRPSADMIKATAADKRSSNVPYPGKDVHTSPGESTGRERTGDIFTSSPSPATRSTVDVFTTHSSRAPSRKGGDGGRLLEAYTSKSVPVAAAPVKEKLPPPPLSDGEGGLWALRQEQQRPTSAGSMMPQPPAATAAASSEDAHVRPATSPTRVIVEHLPRQERVNRFGSSPSANKIAGKKEQLQVHAVQKAFDQELQQVVLSEYGGNETDNSSVSIEQELKPIAASSSSQQQQHQADEFSSESDRFEQASPANASASDQPSTAAAAGGDESHVMIKHSTDPYADFKNSMLRMIYEEDLYEKQRELEELFQYYLDLNPAVHHEVLNMVIFDIRRDIAADKSRLSIYVRGELPR